MENKIVTMASRKFGTVRKIVEGDKVIFCGADVAKALGYSNARKALTDHCRCVTKRYTPHPQSNRKQIEMSFIPESDVYRLICHSKLPSALEFEKWVFEDVVPKAVDKQLNAKPEQLTLETAEYHYFDKTYKGEPFITLADFEHFTGITCDMARYFIKVHCKAGRDYLILSKTDLQELRRENPGIGSRIKSLTILKKQAVKMLLKYYDRGNNMPECFSKRHALPEKCSNRSVEIERVSPWEKYKHLGTYNESIIDKLLSEHGIYLYGETIIPKEIAFKYFVPAAVHTVLDKMYKDRHLTSESVLIDTNNLDDSDFVYTIKGINRKGLVGMVSVHNIIVAGDVKFYDKGKLPEEYASLY